MSTCEKATIAKKVYRPGLKKKHQQLNHALATKRKTQIYTAPPSTSGDQRDPSSYATSSYIASGLKKQPKKPGSDSKNSSVKTSSKFVDESSSSEMLTTSVLVGDELSLTMRGGNIVEKETSLDCNQMNTSDDEESTLLDISTKSEKSPIANSNSKTAKNDSAQGITQKLNDLMLYHDDEEINQVPTFRNSSSDDDFFEDGAVLTLADDSTQCDGNTFVVYPLGSCEFDETEIVSTSSSRALQKSIFRLSNNPKNEEKMCWGLDQEQPILMRLLCDHIQFTDLKNQTVIRCQPIQTIRTWAVDDENNFAFVAEDRNQQGGHASCSADQEGFDSINYALLSGPAFMCYVLRSLDDDEMSCKVAAKLNHEINRYREQMSNRMSRCTKIQQTIAHTSFTADQTDTDEDLEDELEESGEVTMEVKYIGKAQVPCPTGIEVLNVAIDKCLANASSKTQFDRLLDSSNNEANQRFVGANLHVSPSSVIVENVQTGEIMVECRIRYLTFMGISRRDSRWCGFIMQNTSNKNFVAHCFECQPTAANVCDAIQASCMNLYQKISKNKRHSDVTSIVPKSSTIRDALAKTFSRIKLTPII